MKLHIDRDVCDQHAQCVLAAPELFHFDDTGELAYPEQVPAVLEPEAVRAATLCPVRAIRTEN